MQRLDRRAIFLYLIRYGSVPFAVAIILGILTVTRSETHSAAGLRFESAISQLTYLAGFVVAAGIVAAFVWAFLTWYFTRYDFAGDPLRIETGIVFQTSVAIPRRQIQHMQVERDLFERLLGLATLRIETAGNQPGKDSEGVLVGIDSAAAVKISGELVVR